MGVKICFYLNWFLYCRKSMNTGLALSIAKKLYIHKVISQISGPLCNIFTTRPYSTMDALADNMPTEDEAKVPNKTRTRYNGRIKKRLWEEGTGNTKKLKEDEPFIRIKKRKMAMILGYSGVGYFGMQRNPGVSTIEEDLLNALLKAEYIDNEGFNCMQQIDFQRAARTDKGVSAVSQIVSIKLPEATDVEKINEHLPEFIRVFGVKRVTKGFNSKTQCDARTYSYTLPSFAFDKSVTSNNRKDYLIPQQKIEEINKVLSIYKGTKNYHNFTSRRSFTDPSCLRYMISFQVDKVFVQSDMEFILLKVKGQSFMLHQIRKMVGAALAVMRSLITMETVERAFTEDKVNLPIAPGLGLLLEQVHYDRYNTRYGKDGIHATLEWTELQDVIEQFKMKYIIPNTVKTEISERSMEQWLEYLDTYSYEKEFDYPNDDEQEETSGEKPEKEVVSEENDREDELNEKIATP